MTFAANKMTPSRLQAPPRPFDASASSCAFPPGRSRRFSLASAKKPIARLSGAQNGNVAPSVLGRGWAVV